MVVENSMANHLKMKWNQIMDIILSTFFIFYFKALIGSITIKVIVDWYLGNNPIICSFIIIKESKKVLLSINRISIENSILSCELVSTIWMILHDNLMLALLLSFNTFIYWIEMEWNLTIEEIAMKRCRWCIK